MDSLSFLKFFISSINPSKDIDMSVFVNLLLKYFENNPAQVEQLVAALVQALIAHLSGQKSS